MRPYGRLLFGLGLGALLIASIAAVTPGQRADQGVQKLGVGPAYDLLGKIAVMHQGRVKPLDTVAREEVKQVFSRETVKLLNDENQVVETWGPVGAFVDWIVRPEFWDSQPFILVDYLPLKRQILLGRVREELRSVAANESTSAADRAKLEALAGDPEISTGDMAEFLNASKLGGEARKTLTALADKLHEDHKWLTPDEVENAKISHGDHDESFIEWVAQLDDQRRKFDADPNSDRRLTEVEKRAIDVGQRLVTYKSYSGDEMRSAGLIRIMPRPWSKAALEYYKEVLPKARTVGDARALAQTLSPIEFDSLKALDTFWNDTPIDDRRTPGEDPAFDAKFGAWLNESSVWVPLKVLLKADPEGLVKAGYPDAEVRAFLAACRELESAESAAPGRVSEEAATRLLTTSRALGESVSPGRYPTLAAMDRESHFNAANPFWKAPFAYGTALALLAVALGFAGGRRAEMSGLGKSIYGLGMLALAAGIGLEVYGFYLRIAISGWAPVTNMYETVIWVALVTAVLSLVFELVYRRTFSALAGAGVALLGTITAANVPLLDPSIKSLQPVLRSNLWLTIHVLTEVSSYAAFGLAWGLGLIATFYYLTAAYRRSPTFKELAAPLLPGLPLLATGGAGAAASYGMFGDSWTTGDPLFYVFATMAGIGWMLTLGTVLACSGEVVNRLTTRGLDEAPGGHEEGPHHAPTGRNRPSVEAIKAMAEAAPPLELDARGRSMQQTAAMIKPLSNFIYRAMQVGVLLISAGTILGGVWADYSWGRFWGWDPKEVWALITLLVYLVPLHGRFAGWVNTFGLVFASVVCFLSVVMAWYGVNFVLGVGLHSYGFVDGGSQGFMSLIIVSMTSLPLAAAWRRWLGYHSIA